MPPVWSEEPPNPTESEEEELSMAEVEDNLPEDMDEDSSASDILESHGKSRNESRDFNIFLCNFFVSYYYNSFLLQSLINTFTFQNSPH